MSKKRTIFLSETTLEALEELVPKAKMSKFVDNVVIEALRQLAKERALDALEHFDKLEAGGKSVVDTLRDIRREEAGRLTGER